MGTIFIEGSIVGHASPIWKKPKKKDKKVLNKKLSIARANEVELFVHELFQRRMNDIGLHVEFSIECTKERDFKKVNMHALGVGDSQTLKEGGGNENSNENLMRRTDINIIVTHQIEAETGMSVEVLIPEECKDNATNKWAIKIGLSGGVHIVAGATVAIGKLKNRKTGQVAQGMFASILSGKGVGIQTPGIDPGWGDWTNFKTDQKITFDQFNGTRCRLTSIGGGIFLIGYSYTSISFPIYGANSISVGGFNMGAGGLDAGINLGKWYFTGNIPGPPCVSEHFEADEEAIPYTYDVKESLMHTVFFDTGSSEMSIKELNHLENFVNEIADMFVS